MLSGDFAFLPSLLVGTGPLTGDLLASIGVTLVAVLEVRPAGSQGFAATILAAFAVLGVLVLVMMFVSSKPRNRRRGDDLRRR